jgi:hypothetical protein
VKGEKKNFYFLVVLLLFSDTCCWCAVFAVLISSISSVSSSVSSSSSSSSVSPPLGFCLSAYLGGEVVVGGDLDCELGGDAEEGRSESLPGSERAFSPEGHVETIRGSTIQANTIPAVTKNNIHTQTRGMILIERREKIPHNTMRWTSKTPTTHDTTHQNAVSQ